MQSPSPHMVGIVGGSCAGKSWLADRLQCAFEGKAARLSQDDFYFDRSYLSPGRRARLNFDHPRAIDWERLERVLSTFASGRTAAVPRYDFATHGRLQEESELKPSRFLIVEGLWLFRRPDLRRLFDLKIFIRSSKELCIERRLQRDTRERGRTYDQVLDQLKRHTLPMSERYVAPQEKWADLVLDAPIDEGTILELVTTIETNLNPVTVGI